MTPEQIIENNILLAKFMGFIDNGSSEDGFLIHPNTNYDISISSLNYNSDWNWLMQAVKAIGDRTEYELVSGYNYSYWNRYGENPILDKEDIPQEFGGYSDIINIYEACVAFVKWYNQNKGGK